MWSDLNWCVNICTKSDLVRHSFLWDSPGKHSGWHTATCLFYPFIFIHMCALKQWSSYWITSVAVILLQDRGCKLSCMWDSRQSKPSEDTHIMNMCTDILLYCRGMCSHLWIPPLEFHLKRLQNITSVPSLGWEGGTAACLVLSVVSFGIRFWGWEVIVVSGRRPKVLADTGWRCW